MRDKPVILNPSGDPDHFPYRLYRRRLELFLLISVPACFILGFLTPVILSALGGSK